MLRNDDGREFWAARAVSIRSPLRLLVEFDLATESFTRAEQDLSVDLIVFAKGILSMRG